VHPSSKKDGAAFRLDLQTDMFPLFLSADHHFGHANIIVYAKRPFKDTEVMETALMERHNALVPKKESVVLFLGDFLWGKPNDTANLAHRLRRLVPRLHGEVKILLLGNHDKLSPKTYLEAGFSAVVEREGDLRLVTRCGEVRACHSPMRLYRQYLDDLPDEADHELYDLLKGEDLSAIRGRWFCGHVHTCFRKLGPVINVGVDVWDYAPVPFEEAAKLFSGR